MVLEPIRCLLARLVLAGVTAGAARALVLTAIRDGRGMVFVAAPIALNPKQEIEKPKQMPNLNFK